jgi:sigma-E factor negative regulatory protein RseC
MVEENAVVVALEDNAAWVETRRKAACDSCGVNKGCGTAVISKVFGNRRSRMRVLTRDMTLRVGDEVVIGLQEHALLRGSMIVYGVPLLSMFVGALLADYCTRRWWGIASDGLDIAFGVCGLIAGLVWLRRYSTRIARDPRYQPEVLRVSTLRGSIHGNLTRISARLLT